MPFHAYEDGNLNWLAAAEVESATSSMCLRVCPTFILAHTSTKTEEGF